MQRVLVSFVVLLVGIPAVALAISVGQVDNFQDATLQGWASGMTNPLPPVNQNNQGPDGAGDRAMVLTANGSVGAGGKLVVFNQEQWTGNYTAEGVESIRMDLLNPNEDALTVRVVLRGGGGAFSTSQAAVLDPSPEFTQATLSLLPEDLTFVGVGAGDVDATLANVTEVRILHSVMPDERGDLISGQLVVDNITALGVPVVCATGVAKADRPADFLLLPAFEVDTLSNDGLTTFFAVRNQTDELRVARIQYFDASGDLLSTSDVRLEARRTRSFNVRGVDIDGLVPDADGVARGTIKILACSESGEGLESSLTGDYFYLDGAGNFATGDQLSTSGDLCDALQARLVNFGSGIKLRLYSTEPQGLVTPSGSFSIFNEAGDLIGSGPLFLENKLEILDLSAFTTANFGTLVLEFSSGVGAMNVEYSAFGRFSVGTNAICLQTQE